MIVEPNPLKWSGETVRSLGQAVTLVITVGGPLVWVGQGFYNFAKAQTELIEQVRNMQGQLVDQKASIGDENKQRTQALNGLKDDLNPRIMKLEDAVIKAENEAAAVHTRTEDMKKSLDRIEDLAVRNLTVSESHTAPIKQTRDAVVPTPGVDDAPGK